MCDSDRYQGAEIYIYLSLSKPDSTAGVRYPRHGFQKKGKETHHDGYMGYQVGY